MSRKRYKKEKIGGQFVPIPFIQINSTAWKKLSGNAVKLLIEIYKNNWPKRKTAEIFTIPCACYKEFSDPTFYKYLDKLTKLGFLNRTEKGGLYNTPSKYTFSEEWKKTNSDFMREEKRKSDFRKRFEPWGGVLNEENEQGSNTIQEKYSANIEENKIKVMVNHKRDATDHDITIPANLNEYPNERDTNYNNITSQDNLEPKIFLKTV